MSFIFVVRRLSFMIGVGDICEGDIFDGDIWIMRHCERDIYW